VTWTELAVLFMVLERVGMFAYGGYKAYRSLTARKVS
jgi:hypothetical protein